MTRARDLARLGNSQALTVDTNLNVGIGSTTPDSKLDVVGIVSATSFYGDLTGNATGLSGTPNLNVGVVTATSFAGDGANLTGLNIPAGYTELDSMLFG